MKVYPENFSILHAALRNRDKKTIRRPFPQQNTGKSLPHELRIAIERHQYWERDQFAERGRTPKLVLPPESTPNVVVSVAVINQRVQESPQHILVVLNSGDLMVRSSR